MKRFSMILGIVVGAILLLGFVMATFTSGQKETEEAPTVVVRGRATEKEKIYTRAFKKEESYRDRKSLADLTGQYKRNGTLTVRIGKLNDYVIKLDGEQRKNKAEKLQDAICQSDVIVVGSIQGKSVHLLDDETFVYTAYKFHVDDILKGPATLEKNDELEVVRPGGLIKLDGQVIRAIDESFAPLRAGEKYLLFLRFLPESGGYMPAAAEADYSVEGDSLNKLDTDETVPLQKVPRQLVDDALTTLMSQPCWGIVHGGVE